MGLAGYCGINRSLLDALSSKYSHNVNKTTAFPDGKILTHKIVYSVSVKDTGGEMLSVLAVKLFFRLSIQYNRKCSNFDFHQTF